MEQDIPPSRTVIPLEKDLSPLILKLSHWLEIFALYQEYQVAKPAAAMKAISQT